ncbi:MAG: hypothetical protein U0X20_16055 [Caldilineaceae bacterium]
MCPPLDQTQMPGARRQAARLLPLLLLTMLLAGCRSSQQTSSDGPQVLSTLPQGWTPVVLSTSGLFNRNTSYWAPINIDNDLATEYLLYFTYDNGQLGAIIYDQQTGSSGVVNATPVPAPNQPASVYVPYQVEPSYWRRTDAPDTVGYIAPPGTSAEALKLVQVERYPAGQPNMAGTANPDPGSDVPPTNEAIIYGGSTVITVLWWRNAFNGYGMTQMEALRGLTPGPPPAGDIERPLQTVDGLTPLTGLLARSVMCRKTHFTRVDATNPPDVIEPIYQSPVRYAESDGGIVFCMSVPAYPYYPEGVVLAYLNPPPPGEPADGQPVDLSQQYLWSGLNDAQRAAINATVVVNGTGSSTGSSNSEMVVRELRAPASVALPPAVRTADGPPITTSVCAEIVSGDGTQLKRLLFSLLYEPVQENGATVVPERFAITAVTDVTDVLLNCTLVIP